MGSSTASEVLDAIASLRPDETPTEQLRLAFLYALHQTPVHTDMAEIESHLDQLLLKLSAVSDQHAAVSADLERLASEELCEFSPDHIWTLVRALRVQNQILNYYLGDVAQPTVGTAGAER